MKIVRKRQFLNSIKLILLYIAEDKPTAAKKFYKDLEKSFLLLAQNPKMYKQSIYFENEFYRDMTFMGYTVVYKITDESIEILDIFKWQDKDLKEYR
jgi:plasmid stabilization system protein ParE